MAFSEFEQLASSTLLAQTGLLVIASDAAGRVALLSPGMQELYELPFEPVPEEEISARFRLFTPDGSTPLPTQDVPLVRARRGEVVRDALVVSRTRSGRLLYLRSNASPLIGPDGRVNGAIVLVQDVTGERAALERQAELRERLLETINHHLRTPVTNLLGYAEMLDDQRAGIITPDAQRAVDAVLRAAHTLASLLATVSALVDLDRHTQLTKTYGDLPVVVQQVADALTPLFDENGVALRVDQPSTLCVVVDFAEVRRAVSELLKNAARYAPPGSTVRLQTTCDARGVRITISDTGPGLDQDERARLIRPFERGTHPRQDVTGRGLGLAIAHTIAVAHGGTLELSDNTPHGLRASLQLPVR